MPKMKTNSAASKRAKITGTGKVKHAVPPCATTSSTSPLASAVNCPPTMCCAAARPRSCTSFCRSEHRAYPEITRL